MRTIVVKSILTVVTDSNIEVDIVQFLVQVSFPQCFALLCHLSALECFNNRCASTQDEISKGRYFRGKMQAEFHLSGIPREHRRPGLFAA